MSEEGFFYGIQWPAVMVKRKSDGKILSVSRKKIRVYEKQYTCPLDQKATYDGDVKLEFQEIKDDFEAAKEQALQVQVLGEMKCTCGETRAG